MKLFGRTHVQRLVEMQRAALRPRRSFCTDLPVVYDALQWLPKEEGIPPRLHPTTTNPLRRARDMRQLVRKDTNSTHWVMAYRCKESGFIEELGKIIEELRPDAIVVDMSRTRWLTHVEKGSALHPENLSWLWTLSPYQYFKTKILAGHIMEESGEEIKVVKKYTDLMRDEIGEETLFFRCEDDETAYRRHIARSFDPESSEKVLEEDWLLLKETLEEVEQLRQEGEKVTSISNRLRGLIMEQECSMYMQYTGYITAVNEHLSELALDSISKDMKKTHEPANGTTMTYAVLDDYMKRLEEQKLYYRTFLEGEIEVFESTTAALERHLNALLTGKISVMELHQPMFNKYQRTYTLNWREGRKPNVVGHHTAWKYDEAEGLQLFTDSLWKAGEGKAREGSRVVLGLVRPTGLDIVPRMFGRIPEGEIEKISKPKYLVKQYIKWLSAYGACVSLPALGLAYFHPLLASIPILCPGLIGGMWFAYTSKSMRDKLVNFHLRMDRIRALNPADTGHLEDDDIPLDPLIRAQVLEFGLDERDNRKRSKFFSGKWRNAY